MWRWICLRGSGFPAHLAEKLTAPDSAAAADRLLLLEVAADEGIKAAITAFQCALQQTADDAQRKLLYRGLTRLNKRRVPERTGTSVDFARDKLSELCSQVEQCRNQFTKKFESGAWEVSSRIREIAADPLFRQAVLLQNRGALRRVVHSFSAQRHSHAKRGFKDRQNEELIANYLQRYCLKNDTIGFFGPVGWAKLVANENQFAVHPGPALISKSSIYFENWCIESLAEKMATIKSLRPWIAPRLLPLFRVDGTMLYTPDGTIFAIPPLHAAILQRCGGDHTAREIAREVIAIPESGVRTEAQIYAILLSYTSRGITSWTFEIPFCLHPEKILRGFLERIEKEQLRRSLLDELDALEGARDSVDNSIGDAEQLDHALCDLDATFTRLTGRVATQSAGAMYAARTLIYQDCQRDVNVEIGPSIVAALGTPLSLLLGSARWFSYQAAATYRRKLRQLYEEFVRRNGSQDVGILEFWAKMEPLIFDPAEKLFNDVVPKFQSRWEKILQIPTDVHRLEYKSSDLKPLVEDTFAIPSAGWQLARYQSPDVMIAASSVDAIRRGDCMFVLGEIHMAGNTLRSSWATSQHPNPEELFEAIKRDLPKPRVVPVPPRHWPRVTNRTSMVLVSSEDYYLEIASAPVANGPRSRVIPISAFVVEDSEEGLMVRTRDGRMKFDIIEFLGELLSGAAIELMKIVSPRSHVPRIMLDRLVIVRESWSFPATDLPFTHQETEHERYLEARRWMHKRGLPRFVFVRIPVEVKPFYVDFESPIYVEIFIKMIRRMLASDRGGEPITVTEMLPTPGHLWLPDADGQRYTSELRIVVFDLAE
jgi:hypothetical protein